jgi:cytoskeletal protein RodZ
MNKTNQGWWVAVLCVVALAGCAADQWNSKSDDNSGYNAPRSTASSSTSTNSTGSTSSPATAAGSSVAMPAASAGAMPATDSASPAQATYGMVQAIDPMPRQDLGVGVAGAAAAGGTTGASPDVLYRITVRMDDGSNQTTVVDALPSYKVGDRVRYNNGAISPY